MGWNFRRSMTLCKGVRLNFGKNGMSVSSGVKGFRKTYNLTTGQKTTTFGIPGTGIYYTSREGGKKKKDETYAPSSSYGSSDFAYSSNTSYGNTGYTGTASASTVAPEPKVIYETRYETKYETKYIEKKKQLNHEEVKGICRVADDKIDWFEILSSRKPVDKLFNKEAWEYFHSVALKVCQGDIDTYLKVIQDINPYEDLLDYAEKFEFGSDSADEMHVSFVAKTDVVDENDYELFEDYVCACAVRVARDTFALLPIEKTHVTVEIEGRIIIDVYFDKKRFDGIKFTYSDPSEIIDYFN